MANVEDSESSRMNRPNWGFAGEAFKYTSMIAIVVVAGMLFKKKLGGITWAQIWEGIQRIPPWQIALAVLVTCINFVVLTGYDWISVKYLKKNLSISKIMQGAVMGYALSNVFGWILGGTAIRFRLYTNWGFRFSEVVAFVSILSVTFWLGMFLLAGISFAMLPVQLPKTYEDAMPFPLHTLGYLFLVCVGIYVLATIFIRRPIRIGKQTFVLPPFKMSLVQLLVSAADFVLASLVLYLLLPSGVVNYSTVLVSYLAAMIVVVFLHVPGGLGVLETVVLSMLASSDHADGEPVKVAVTSALLVYRVIYYLIPAAVAGLMFIAHEIRHKRKLAADALGAPREMDPEI
jgi:uncharacterized membrane protein YbhN (UPF0104 family)